MYVHCELSFRGFCYYCWQHFRRHADETTGISALALALAFALALVLTLLALLDQLPPWGKSGRKKVFSLELCYNIFDLFLRRTLIHRSCLHYVYAMFRSLPFSRLFCVDKNRSICFLAAPHTHTHTHTSPHTHFFNFWLGFVAQLRLGNSQILFMLLIFWHSNSSSCCSCCCCCSSFRRLLFVCHVCCYYCCCWCCCCCCYCCWVS